MFRIRKITDIHLPANVAILDQVREILIHHFPTVNEKKMEAMLRPFREPLGHGFLPFLFIAEDGRSNVLGFAIVSFMERGNFYFLDFLAVRPGRTSVGIGGALYEHVREDAELRRVIGIFMECLPDDPAVCKNKDWLPQNIARMAFYERFGARPILGTAYETPVGPEDDCPPYLVYDSLGRKVTLTAGHLKTVIRQILVKKYPDYCPLEYVRKVVSSVKKGGFYLREYRYQKREERSILVPVESRLIPLIKNEKHEIHHVKERGYLEAPVRIVSIMKELEKLEVFQNIPASKFPDKYILEVHNKKYMDYFQTVCEKLPPGKSIYPYVFPVRNATRPPKDYSVLAGYYCIDTFTPLNRNAYLAARNAVDCSLTGAKFILEGAHAAYALVRPPGHHAERDVFGGFCYFNNASIAAHYLSRYGKVALLDVDYHHGNGHQQIFWQRKDVFTLSIHGNPTFAYPYFSGFADEVGEGDGKGYNINFPLKESISGEEYAGILRKALQRIRDFNPDFLVVSLGFDPAKGDPTGTWSLTAKDFLRNGQMLGELPFPILFVQEGGYKTRTLGINARSFFTGFILGRKKYWNR